MGKSETSVHSIRKTQKTCKQIKVKKSLYSILILNPPLIVKTAVAGSYGEVGSGADNVEAVI